MILVYYLLADEVLAIKSAIVFSTEINTTEKLYNIMR